LIAAVANNVEDYCRICGRTLSWAYCESKEIIFHIFHDILGLVKKSARWVTKIVNDKNNQERVTGGNKFLAMVQQPCWNEAMLENFVRIEKLVLAFHMR